jgi:hypothetical protein
MDAPPGLDNSASRTYRIASGIHEVPPRTCRKRGGSTARPLLRLRQVLSNEDAIRDLRSLRRSYSNLVNGGG